MKNPLMEHLRYMNKISGRQLQPKRDLFYSKYMKKEREHKIIVGIYLNLLKEIQ